MSRNYCRAPFTGSLSVILVWLNVLVIRSAYINDKRLYGMLAISLPLLVIVIYQTIRQKKPRVVRRKARQPEKIKERAPQTGVLN